MNISELSYEQVVSMAEKLNTASGNMKEILDQIKSLFENVGDEQVWSGTAATTTKGKFDDLSAKFPDFYDAINDCYKYLLSVVENYKAVDQMITGQQ